MVSRIGWKSLAVAGAAIVAIAVSSPAFALIPQDPCKLNAPVVSEEIGIASHSKQPQKNWQREGRDIDITISSAKMPTSAQAVVCFRWKLNNEAAEGAKAFLDSPLQSATIANVEGKPVTPVKFTAVVPTLIQQQPPPKRPDFAERDKVAGVYSSNKTFPIAEVRVLLFEARQTSRRSASGQSSASAS